MDPIEVDMGEGMKTWRVLPGYAWARDSKSIVIAQGGKIRRVDAASGTVDTIPFTARVKRTVSEMAYKNVEIPDGPFDVKFARWQTASPDGRRLAFQAVGRIWIMDMGGAGLQTGPRRLTPDAFGSQPDSPRTASSSRPPGRPTGARSHSPHGTKIRPPVEGGRGQCASDTAAADAASG